MWDSTSQINGGRKYEVGQLALFINFLGYELSRLEGDEGMPLPKDAEYSNHYCSFLDGITNGEFVWCASEILNEMLRACLKMH
jgi:hypothetical protein